jgi:hypothetical protein
MAAITRKRSRGVMISHSLSTHFCGYSQRDRGVKKPAHLRPGKGRSLSIGREDSAPERRPPGPGEVVIDPDAVPPEAITRLAIELGRLFAESELRRAADEDPDRALLPVQH